MTRNVITIYTKSTGMSVSKARDRVPPEGQAPLEGRASLLTRKMNHPVEERFPPPRQYFLAVPPS